MTDPAAFPATIATSDGLALACHARWPAPEVGTRAGAVIVHGLGDHRRSVTYTRIADALVARGIACFLYDQRGFGESPGPRGDAPSFDRLRDDLSRVVDRASDAVRPLPLFLIGMSAGGLLVLDQSIERPAPLAAVVVGAPALEVPAVPKWLVRVAPIVRRLAPGLRLEPGLDVSALSKDAAAAQAYVDDPLFVRRITVRYGAMILREMRRVLRASRRHTLPLLVLHGEADRITSAEGSRRFLQFANGEERLLILYRDAVHNPLIDEERDAVLEDLVQWLERRMTRRDATNPDSVPAPARP